MKLEIILRNENSQEHNTWWSNNDHPEQAEIQLHSSRELYLLLGSPRLIKVIIEGADERSEAI